jgi:hypothetical protein
MNLSNCLKIAAIVAALVTVIGCEKGPSKEEIEAKAQELLREQKAKEEAAVIETARIAEEQARVAQLAEEKRQQIAEELSTREGAVAAQRQAKLEAAAAEMARRETIVAEVKGFVDSLEIRRSQINEETKTSINEEPAESGLVLVSPSGYSVRYAGAEGDYYSFSYDDEYMTVSLKRTLRGLAFPKVEQKQPLAEGVPAAGANFSVPTMPTTGRLIIMEATYGSGSTQRDVKELLKSKISDGKLRARADNGEMGGDPAFGQVKELRVKYIGPSGVKEQTYREGEEIELP